MKIGIRLNFVPVEFQSLIERITRTQHTRPACSAFPMSKSIPNSQMNIWMSSGSSSSLESRPGEAGDGMGSRNRPAHAGAAYRQRSGGEKEGVRRRSGDPGGTGAGRISRASRRAGCRLAFVAQCRAFATASAFILEHRISFIWTALRFAQPRKTIRKKLNRARRALGRDLGRLPGAERRFARGVDRSFSRRNGGAGGPERVGQEHSGTGDPAAARSHRSPRARPDDAARPGSDALRTNASCGRYAGGS